MDSMHTLDVTYCNWKTRKTKNKKEKERQRKDVFKRQSISYPLISGCQATFLVNKTVKLIMHS